jgi:hypothetical protein
MQEMNVTSCLVNLNLAEGVVRLAWLHLQETVALGNYCSAELLLNVAKNLQLKLVLLS